MNTNRIDDFLRSLTKEERKYLQGKVSFKSTIYSLPVAVEKAINRISFSREITDRLERRQAEAEVYAQFKRDYGVLFTCYTGVADGRATYYVTNLDENGVTAIHDNSGDGYSNDTWFSGLTYEQLKATQKREAHRSNLFGD